MRINTLTLLLIYSIIFGTNDLNATELSTRTLCVAPETPNLRRYILRQRATVDAEQKLALAQKLLIRPVDELAPISPSEEAYLARNRPGVVCEQITYQSDGLTINGFLWYPASMKLGEKLPLILFNRGGTGDDSKLRANTQFGFERFVRAGYIVIGSQYRGNDGSEGRDEIGGDDVHDVLNLLNIARTLHIVDPKNVFALGYSRGAMMTLSAVRDGAHFNAVALVGLPADLRKRKDRPAAELINRSSITFIDKLNVPILLLQGSADPFVSTSESTLPFAGELQKKMHAYELVIYNGDTHGIVFNSEDKDRRILDWFKRFYIN